MPKAPKRAVGRFESMRGPTGKIGHYGCSASGGGRLVRVALAGDSKPPRSAMVACPVCGNDHVVAIVWRQPRDEVDESREAELMLDDTHGIG